MCLRRPHQPCKAMPTGGQQQPQRRRHHRLIKFLDLSYWCQLVSYKRFRMILVYFHKSNKTIKVFELFIVMYVMILLSLILAFIAPISFLSVYSYFRCTAAVVSEQHVRAWGEFTSACEDFIKRRYSFEPLPRSWFPVFQDRARHPTQCEDPGRYGSSVFTFRH